MCFATLRVKLLFELYQADLAFSQVVKRGTLRLMSSATRGLLRARTWKLRHCEVEIGANWLRRQKHT